MTTTAAFKVGDKVTYTAHHGAEPERGIVTSLHPTNPYLVYVVYACNGDWANYQNYTGAGTSIDALEHGWKE